LNDLREKYTKKGSPAVFKKVWKYDSLYNWATKFLEVVKAAKESDSSQQEVDSYLKEIYEVEDEISHVNQCLDDLSVFGYDQLKDEQVKIQAFIWRIEQDNKVKMIAR